MVFKKKRFSIVCVKIIKNVYNVMKTSVKSL